MKNKIINIILSVLLIFTIFKCNQKEVKTIEIEIPSKSGKFNFTNITNTPIKIDTIEKKVIEYKDSIIYITNNKLDDSLLQEYKNLKNEYDRLKLFSEVITYNKFNKKFEDNYIIGNIEGKARGKVKSLNFNYTTKPRIEKFDIPKSLEFYSLLELGVPLQPVNNFNFKTTVFIKTKSDFIYSLGGDAEGRIYLGTGIKF